MHLAGQGQELGNQPAGGLLIGGSVARIGNGAVRSTAGAGVQRRNARANYFPGAGAGFAAGLVPMAPGVGTTSGSGFSSTSTPNVSRMYLAGTR